MSFFKTTSSVTGEQAVVADINRTLELMRARVAEAMEELGEETAFIAAGEAPRKTGRMARSIKAHLQETEMTLTEIIAPGKVGRILSAGVVNHGTFHNKGFGSSKKLRARIVEHLRTNGEWRIQPHPFLTDAENEMRGRVDARLREAADAAIAEAAK